MTAPPAEPNTQPPPVVELEHVAMEYAGREFLHDLSLRAYAGERLVILGRSGSGKSTVLRLALGLIRPSRGAVRFSGLNIHHLGRRRLNAVRQRIGMVFQSSALISSLSVRDNLALPLEELTSRSRAEIDHTVMEKLHWVGLSEAKNKMPAELSGGMRKRIGLARGIILDPELILYDEPGAGLDPISSSLIDELIISLSEKLHATSLIVTHEMTSAFRVATRMAMLAEGRILAEGPPEAFRHHPDPTVAQFISGSIGGAAALPGP